MTKEILQDRKGPDALVLATYEAFLVGAPHVTVDGLWAVDEQYYLLCPGLDPATKAADGSSLRQWLAEQMSVPSPPIEIVQEVPSSARRVEPRPLNVALQLGGLPRIPRDVFVDIALAVGPAFPSFSIAFERDEVEIHISRELKSSELHSLRIAVEGLGMWGPVSVVHPSVGARGAQFYRAQQADLVLTPSHALPLDTPRKVRWLIEEDEAFWMSQRGRLFGTAAEEPGERLPSGWNGKELRCVVDATAFPPANIRSYLTLFDTVFMALPLGERFEQSLSLLGVTRAELTELVATGRVKILLPQPIDRYDTSWLSDGLEAAGENFIASRRLASCVVADTRTRMPFLNPPLEFDERRLLMGALNQAADDSSLHPDIRLWFRIIAEEAHSIWGFAPWAIHREGAMQTPRVGIGWLGSRLHQEFTGEERIVEIMGAAAAVEWAACLNAHVFPKGVETQTDEAACNLLAALSSPLEQHRVPIADARSHNVVDDLLAIENDAPVVEFAKNFRGPDVDNFRKLVSEITTWNQDESYLRAAVERFNAEVRRYERRPERVRTMNLVGAAAATSVAVVTGLPKELGAMLPLGVWLLGTLINLGAEPTRGNAVLGSLWDRTNAVLAGTSRRAVLVSRLRKQLSVMKI